MTKHLIDAFEEIKKAQVGSRDEIGVVHFWKISAGYDDWGKIMDLRDFEAFTLCSTWAKLIRTVKKMEKKYQKLWVLAGKPENYEKWKKVLDRDSPGSVGKEYWDTYHSSVRYGKRIVARTQ